MPEYPRPQLVRESWRSLNGLWDYAITRTNEVAPELYTGKILVPFPIEAPLSRVGKRLDEHSTLWHRTRFSVPAAWSGQALQLHFGAVDWAARVFVNGRFIGQHRGGFDSFSLDITTAVRQEGENELLVAVEDPTEGDQPRGKQSRKPEGIFYTPSSGIWQTVWLEPLPRVHIQTLRLVPDTAAKLVRVLVMANTLAPEVEVEVRVTFAGQGAGAARGLPGAEVQVPLNVAHFWSPEDPALYDVEATLRQAGRVLDRVRSYFGFREIRLGSDASGVRRLFLNGRPVFQLGVLDQGFWPDGLYTAPSDEALRFDLETVRTLGFNLVRKHVKVEPERWYYWADKLGLLVWQDMPSGNNATEPGRRQFEAELQHWVEQRANHPSIIMWVLFNEGWGQFDTERLVGRIKAADSSRLVDNASGWTDLKVGEVLDLHSYPDPIAPAPDNPRAGVLGEFGGLGLVVSNHTWSTRAPWGYQLMNSAEQLMRAYAGLLDKTWALQKSNGLAAAVYTQLTDVETECNGFLTYDRAVLKLEPPCVVRANLRPPMLVPDAREAAVSWSYTFVSPAGDWMQPDFDASSWQTGPGGFGTPGTPEVRVGTVWDKPDIWLRREFVLPEGGAPPSVMSLSHDEDAEVYLNGILAVRATGFIVGYTDALISTQAKAALRPGRNVMAIHCHQTTGGQYIDAGLWSEPLRPKTPK